MPQMMPINWYFLVFMFIGMYNLFIIVNFSNKFSLIKKPKKTSQKNNLFWLW
uniref:ATP synthase F0 subunit 8 n=1 Tax=Acraea epaea TaxID=1156531 RepID=A0A140CVA9_9NEOP|nr:ATP synthase F0 subunit 8 [Acraea epaea]